MAQRLRYGPRFKPTVVTVGARYDAQVDFGTPFKRFVRALTPEERSWHSCMNWAKHAGKNSTCYLGKPVKIDERYEAEKRMLERISQCVDVLLFGAQEMMATPLAHKNATPLITQQRVLDLIRLLCVAINRPMPDWGVERRPGIAGGRRCIECGNDLTAMEKERCFRCEETFRDAYQEKLFEQARLDREQKKQAEQTIRVMQKVLRKIENRRRQNARHRGYTGEDVAHLETGGREQDQRVGGTFTYRHSEGDIGHVEGGDDGGASVASEHPTGPGKAPDAETSS